MIKMYTARTSVVDEIEEAVGDIKSQIDFSALKKNAGGILFCHTDFIESGVVAALCDALPFGVIGMSSMASATECGRGLYDLTLAVLTSDEVTFEVGMTEPVNKENYTAEINRLYGSIRGRTEDDPRMIFAFAPYLRNVSGYETADAIDGACRGIPVWGSLPSGMDFIYDSVWTVCGGKATRDSVALMLLNGPVEPKFIVSSIPGHNITKSRGVITKSEGAVVYEINDLPLMEYMENIGMKITQSVVTATPLMLYYSGSTEPVALGFYTLFDDGSALAGGPMPTGTQFALGNINAAGILESAEAGLKKILECKDRQALLLLPCMTRYIMLSPDQDSELRLIEKKLADCEIPFAMGYSGGEICPMPGEDGKWRNRFHNYTFSACVL